MVVSYALKTRMKASKRTRLRPNSPKTFDELYVHTITEKKIALETFELSVLTVTLVLIKASMSPSFQNRH